MRDVETIAIHTRWQGLAPLLSQQRTERSGGELGKLFKSVFICGQCVLIVHK